MSCSAVCEGIADQIRQDQLDGFRFDHILCRSPQGPCGRNHRACNLGSPGSVMRRRVALYAVMPVIRVFFCSWFWHFIFLAAHSECCLPMCSLIHRFVIHVELYDFLIVLFHSHGFRDRATLHPLTRLSIFIIIIVGKFCIHPRTWSPLQFGLRSRTVGLDRLLQNNLLLIQIQAQCRHTKTAAEQTLSRSTRHTVDDTIPLS